MYVGTNLNKDQSMKSYVWEHYRLKIEHIVIFGLSKCK